MKVCYTIATTDLEGGAMSLLDLLKFNKSKKIESHVILTKKHEKLENKLKQLDVKYKIIWHGTDCVDRNKIKQFIKVIVNYISVFRIKKYLKENKIDIVHNNSVLSIVGMQAAYLLNIPYVCHVRESIESGLNLKMINYKKLYFYMNKSSKCIYISNSIKNRYKKYVSERNSIVLYDGLDIEKYMLNFEDVSHNYDNIVLVGRISDAKGQFEAVQAVQILNRKYPNKYHLTLIGTVGEQKYYDDIKKYVILNNMSNIIKILPYSDDLSYLRKTNGISLICSNDEGLGRVTIEAMLSQQLVIGSNKGATVELIEDGVNGFLYEKGNVIQLSNIIENVRKENVKRIITNGYNFALKNFDNSIQSAKVYDLYKKIEVKYEK